MLSIQQFMATASHKISTCFLLQLAVTTRAQLGLQRTLNPTTFKLAGLRTLSRTVALMGAVLQALSTGWGPLRLKLLGGNV